MAQNQGGIPRWLSAVNVLAIIVTLAVVVPRQVGAHRQVAAPQSLCICQRLSPTAVRLTWNDSSPLAQNYILQRSTVQDFSSNSVEIRLAAHSTAFVDETMTYSTAFYYQVLAELGPERSQPSNVVRAGNGPPPAVRPSRPGAPTNLGLRSVDGGLLLTWGDVATNETGMWIDRSGDNGIHWEFIASLPPNTTSQLDRSPPLTAPMYRVWTFNSGGLSPSYAVQWLNPTVVTPSVVPSGIASTATALASAVPTNLTTLIPSNVLSVVPSNLSSPISGVQSVASAAASSAASLATLVPTGIGSYASNVGTVASNLDSFANSEVASVSSRLPSDPSTLVPTVQIPDTSKIKVWFGIAAMNPTGPPIPILSVWILPADCAGTSCPPPRNPTCNPVPFFAQFLYCFVIATS